MSTRKKSAVAPRRVWRITPDHPHGTVIDADAAASASPTGTTTPAPERSAAPPDGSWRASSYDLLNGVEVTDESDTIPDDLFDELFKH